MRHKTRSWLWAGSLLASALSVASCGSVGDASHASRLQAAISGGTPDSTDSNVFLVVSHRSQGIALCSASLIAPNLLLTARHCVSDVAEGHVNCGSAMAGAPFPVNTFYASNSLSIDEVAPAYRISAVSVPSEGNDVCGYDIALLTLATSVPANVAKPLVPRIDRPVVRGEAYSAVGYGLDTPADGGVAGRRRARSGLEVSCVPGACGTGVEASEFVGDTGICSGDSGGPALDDAGKVVGVVSRSGNDCTHPVYGSVASWKDWISQIATQAAEQGKYTAPFWVTSGSSDPPADVIGAAGASSSNVSGQQGSACSAPSDCDAGFACYSASSSGGDGYCAALCSDQSQCASGTQCSAVGGGRVCLAGSTAAGQDTASCSVGMAASNGRAGGGAWLSLALLAWAGCKRRPRGGRGAIFRN